MCGNGRTTVLCLVSCWTCSHPFFLPRTVSCRNSNGFYMFYYPIYSNIIYIWGWVKTYYSHIWGNNHPWKPAMTHRVPRVPCFDPQQRLAQTGPDLLVPVENCLPRMESKQTKGRTLFAHDSFPDNVGLKLEKGESFDRVSLLRNPVQEYRSIPRPWFPRIWRTQTHAHFC